MRQFDVKIFQEYIVVKWIRSFLRVVHRKKRYSTISVFTEERINGFTVRDDESENAEGPILAAVCGWYNV